MTNTGGGGLFADVRISSVLFLLGRNSLPPLLDMLLKSPKKPQSPWQRSPLRRTAIVLDLLSVVGDLDAPLRELAAKALTSDSPNAFTQFEEKFVQRHPGLGLEIIDLNRYYKNEDDLPNLAPVLWMYCWDGSLPLSARKAAFEALKKIQGVEYEEPEW